jgi:preprotein translocase subunit YajC
MRDAYFDEFYFISINCVNKKSMGIKLRFIHVSIVFMFVIAKRQKTERKMDKQKTFCRGCEKNDRFSSYRVN